MVRRLLRGATTALLAAVQITTARAGELPEVRVPDPPVERPARATAPRFRIDELVVKGAARTRFDTIAGLLEAHPPLELDEAAVDEFERRIRNLAIYDAVRVERRGGKLVVTVREKWTLIPSVEFASGKTFRDTYALLGATEYNFLGTANQLGASVYREQRGWGVAAEYVEHAFHRRRWAFLATASLATSEARAEDDAAGWRTTSGFLAAGFVSPPWLTLHSNYEVGGYYMRELVAGIEGDHPPSTHSAGSLMAFSWDHYRWDDLVPRGVRAELSLTTGLSLGAHVQSPRHSADLEATAALPLSSTTVLAAHSLLAIGTRGNINFSYLVGSVEGVRGLPDGLYRNWTQAVLNVELRQAIRFAERWALQGVLFTDAAAFERLTPDGGRGASDVAWSAGAGARLVPTWLANLVFRLDVARLVVPHETWFLQVGLAQYF